MNSEKDGWISQATGDWIETVGGVIGNGVEG